ncbi:TPA: hypothetical protein ACH3X1_004975 [Trebouxia sp. C0004]
MYTQQYRLPGAALGSLLPPASTTASSQSKATFKEQKTQHLQQTDPPQTSVSVQSFNVKLPVQTITKKDLAHRASEIKQAPSKREKIQCLFCTKPARITCLHKLCKKCCNERHPNDCKAHDTGPIGDRDKLKQASVQALTAKASQASVPVSTSYPKLSLTDTKGPESPVLKGVPPGPHAVNLLDIAIIYHQDMQETARWLPAGYKHLDEEQHATAAEAMQNYVTSADLLKQLCQGDTPHLSLHTNRAAPAQSAVVVAQGQGVNPLHGNIHQEMQENDFFDQEPSSARSCLVL